VVAAFFLTNLVIAALLPVLLPLVLGRATPRAFVAVAQSVGLVVFTPLVIAWIVRWLHPAAAGWPARRRDLSFGIWVSRHLFDHGHLPPTLCANRRAHRTGCSRRSRV